MVLLLGPGTIAVKERIYGVESNITPQCNASCVLLKAFM
jgi:hypothetical protein